MSKKLDKRRGSLGKEVKKDKFVDKSLSIFATIRKKKDIFSWVGIGVLVVCGAGGYLYRLDMTKQNKAAHQLSQSLISYTEGDMEKAVTGFEDLIQLYPKTPAGIKSIYWLANIYYFQGKYTEARDYFGKYIKQGKDQLLIQASYLGIADSYLQENNFSTASQKYKEIITKFPHSPLISKALYQELQCYRLSNEPARADSIVQILSKAYPDSPYSQKIKLPIINIM